MIVALLSLLLPDESEALLPLHYYPEWFPFSANDNGDIVDTLAMSVLASKKQMDVEAFAKNLFTFGVGARMAGVFRSNDWGPKITQADRDHVTESAQVRQYCVDWPVDNEDFFGNNCLLMMTLCSGDEAAASYAAKEYAAYLKVEAKSVNREVELSGAVDLTNLPSKPKSTRLQQAAETKAEEWLTVRDRLKVAWFGKMTPKSKQAIEERTVELM